MQEGTVTPNVNDRLVSQISHAYKYAACTLVHILFSVYVMCALERSEEIQRSAMQCVRRTEQQN